MSGLRKTMVGLLRAMMGRHEDASPARLRLCAWLMRHMPGQLTCIELERFVHDYQEGSLSPRERRAFDLHMELCPMCRVYFASYLQTIRLGRKICATDDAPAPAELPEELAAAILAARRAR
jgi:anti-sigma factor RsiW